MNTRLPLLITATLSAALTGCTSTFGCDPDTETFEVDEALTEEDVQAMLDAYGEASVADMSCEQICGHVYAQQTGWMSAVDSCDVDGDDLGLEVTCGGEGYAYFCEGRRPLGHVESGCGGETAMGAHLARCAHLEAASVAAFAQLARQIDRWEAPPELVRRCLGAARDEARHASAVGDLARSYGGTLQPALRDELDASELEAALHNAAEGCVGETWAALMAAWKAARAQDPSLRAAYAVIARDEARHAQLAWDLHDWWMSRLPEAQRAAVRAAQRAALARLPELARGQAASAPPALGLPGPDAAEALARGFAAQLAA